MLRALIKRPAFTIPCVAGLALGIAAASSVFSVWAAVELDTLGFRDPARLAAVWLTDPAHGQQQVELSYADWQALQHVADVALASSVNLDFSLYIGDRPEHADGTTVTGNFFAVTGAKPLAGRFLNENDDRPGDPARIVLAYRFWRSHFHGDRGVIGREVRLGSGTATIIGIARPDFDFPRDVDLWVALRPSWPDVEKSATLGVFRSIARLPRGMSPLLARDRFDAVLHQARIETLGTLVKPVRDETFGSARPAATMLLGGVALLLLIACANAANLTLALHADRAKEFAIRVAVGASRGQMLRMLAAESFAVAVIATASGLLLARAALALFVRFAPIESVALRWPVAQALVLCLVPTALALSLRSRVRTRGFLIGAEVALSTVLAISAGLLARSFAHLSAVDPGFRADRILTFRVTTEIPGQPARRALYTQILEKLRALPGVESAGAVLLRPLSGAVGWDTVYAVEGQSPMEIRSNPNGNYEAISSDYFRTMRIPIVAGRDFDARDTSGGAGAVIINATTARRHWPSANAVGSRLRLGQSATAPWLTVVGVVADVRYREWETPRPDFYVPYLQRAQHRTDFVIRTRTDSPALAAAMRQVVLDCDPTLPISNLTTMDALVDKALARGRTAAWLMGALASCATGLAAIGTYGLLAFLVRGRTREIGVRTALGARPAQIAGMVSLEVLRYVAGGLAMGICGAIAAAGALRSQLYEISPFEPAAYVAVVAVLVAVALAAAAGPALRASRVDPSKALRT